MFKTKLKTFLIIIFILITSLSSFCFADLEEDLVQSGIVQDTQSLEESIDKLPDFIVDNITDSYKPSNTPANTVKKGDAYLIGGDINLDYDIEGNVYILCNTINISSKIFGNAFICANNINVTKTGYISNALYAASSNINFLGKAYDIYTTSNDFYFEGSTFRDIHSIGNTITLNGEVGRNASIAGENLTIKGKILGDLNYSSKEEMKIATEIVSGSIKFETLNYFTFRINYFIVALCFIILVLVLWLLIKWLAPNFINNANNILTQSPFRTFGVGFCSLLAIPGIAVLLLITGLAAIPGLLLLTTYFVLACISSSIFIITINNILAKKLNCDKGFKELLLLIETSIIAWILTIIPYISGIFSIIYIIFGFGILFKNLLNKRKNI